MLVLLIPLLIPFFTTQYAFSSPYYNPYPIQDDTKIQILSLNPINPEYAFITNQYVIVAQVSRSIDPNLYTLPFFWKVNGVEVYEYDDQKIQQTDITNKLFLNKNILNDESYIKIQVDNASYGGSYEDDLLEPIIESPSNSERNLTTKDFEFISESTKFEMIVEKLGGADRVYIKDDYDNQWKIEDGLYVGITFGGIPTGEEGKTLTSARIVYPDGTVKYIVEPKEGTKRR